MEGSGSGAALPFRIRDCARIHGYRKPSDSEAARLVPSLTREGLEAFQQKAPQITLDRAEYV
jgi:hypothetical protein